MGNEVLGVTTSILPSIRNIQVAQESTRNQDLQVLIEKKIFWALDFYNEIHKVKDNSLASLVADAFAEKSHKNPIGIFSEGISVSEILDTMQKLYETDLQALGNKEYEGLPGSQGDWRNGIGEASNWQHQAATFFLGLPSERYKPVPQPKIDYMELRKKQNKGKPEAPTSRFHNHK